MKSIIAVITAFLIFTNMPKGFSQIKLKKGFYCVKSKDHYRENYFTDGEVVFHSETYGRDFSDEDEFVDYVKNMYSFDLYKTKEGYLWGSGLHHDRYIYVIVIPESIYKIYVSSKYNNKAFSDYSTFLLKEVRKGNRGFVDAYGETCEGY